jgi:curved DNA-binding protein CbpA
MEKRTLYDIVGAPQGASREMVASACRRRINQLERNGSKAAAAEIAVVKEAWSVLGDEALRSAYDSSLLGMPHAPQVAGRGAEPLADSATVLLSRGMTKPRHDFSATWGRYRRYVPIVGFICVFAFFAILARPKPEPARKPVEQAKPAEEAFSADKFEQEMKVREAQAKAEVASEKDAADAQARELAAQGGTWILVDGKWERTHNERPDPPERARKNPQNPPSW